MNWHQALEIDSAFSSIHLLVFANYITPYLSPCLVFTKSVLCSNI